MNSLVYVAVLVLQPLLQTKVLPDSGEVRGILPEGYRAKNLSSDMTLALPLIDARGFTSQDGEM